MLRPTLLLLFFIFLDLFTYAEKLTYTVIHDSKPVGNINIDRVKKNDVTEYSFESTVIVKMLLTIKVFDKMDVTFKQNQLIQAHLYRTLNGRVKVNNQATWNGSYYKMTDMDNAVTTIKHQISITTASLYYQEPANVTSVFSEKFQKMVPVKYVGDKRYLLLLPNGNKCYYTYNNGICSLVEAETDWAKLRFVLNK